MSPSQTNACTTPMTSSASSRRRKNVANSRPLSAVRIIWIEKPRPKRNEKIE
jgi:hypothetical protein